MPAPDMRPPCDQRGCSRDACYRPVILVRPLGPEWGDRFPPFEFPIDTLLCVRCVRRNRALCLWLDDRVWAEIVAAALRADEPEPNRESAEMRFRRILCG